MGRKVRKVKGEKEREREGRHKCKRCNSETVCTGKNGAGHRCTWQACQCLACRTNQ